MKTYTALYCALREDGGLTVKELTADTFVEAAKRAVTQTPPDMKLYQLEEQPGQFFAEVEELPPPDVPRAGTNNRGRRKWRDRGGK